MPPCSKIAYLQYYWKGTEDTVQRNGGGTLTSGIFYIIDKIKKGILTIEHEPTIDMVADYFTKPLHGSAFKNFRDVLVNMDPSAKGT